MKSLIMDCMISSPVCIPPGLELKSAMKLMRSKHIRHLPVIRDKQLVGLLSERELRVGLSLPQAEMLRVGDIMADDVFTVTADMPLAKVAKEMAERKAGSAIIVNSEDKVIGIFTTTDALTLLADFADEETIGDLICEEEDYESWPPLQGL